VTRAARITAALLALLVSGLALVACGGGVPGNSVAQVGDESITKSRFEKWLAITAKSSQQVPGQAVAIPDPPEFPKCVAAKRKTAPQAPKGQPKVTDAALKKQCAADYKNLREQTLGRLIQAEWVQGEAAAQNIKVTDAEVRKRFDQQKKQSFPKDKDFEKFLKTSGMTLDDILFQVKVDLIASKLRDKVVKGKNKVTEKEVTDYYAKHKNQFATPERRDIRLVMARSKAKADQALKALKSGQSFKSVVKKYSQDPQTKGTGGLLEGAVKGQVDAGFEQSAFAASKDKLSGPVKGQFGWYVYRVEKISKKHQQALAEVKPSIRQQLIAQGEQKSLNAFVKDFQKKWTARTDCRKGYKVQGCKGYKAPKTTPTGPSQPQPSQPGQPPQEQQQQPPPPQQPPGG
jgi:foldase protein PrsA